MQQKTSEIKEELELKKVQTIHSKEDTTITIQEYLNCLVKDGTILESDIDKIGDLTYITVEGEYIFEIKDNEKKKGDILIIYQGTEENKKPVIYKTEVTNTTSTITVSLGTKYAERATYKYYIVENGEENKNINYGEAKKVSKENEYTYTGLTQGKRYYIKVEIESSNGQKSTKETIGYTSEVIAIENTGSIDKKGWTYETVTITLPEKEEYITQYQKGEKIDLSKNAIWNTYDPENKPTTDKNTKIFYRYNDGINAGNYQVLTIENIDTTEARVTTAFSAPEASITTKGFTLEIGVTDEESGIAKIIWYYKLEGASEYTKVEEAKYNYHTINDVQSGTTIEVSDSLVVDNVTNGTYYVYAEIYNVAGKKTTTQIINNIMLDYVLLSSTYGEDNWKFLYTKTDVATKFIKYNDNYLMNVSYGQNEGAIFTKTKINLTKVKNIVVDFTGGNNTVKNISIVKIGYSDNNTTVGSFVEHKETITKGYGNNDVREQISLNVENVTGNYYIQLYLKHNLQEGSAMTSYLYINSLYLEY